MLGIIISGIFIAFLIVIFLEFILGIIAFVFIALIVIGVLVVFGTIVGEASDEQSGLKKQSNKNKHLPPPMIH
jgi:Co/Zn/Cd efflux system component